MIGEQIGAMGPELFHRGAQRVVVEAANVQFDDMDQIQQRRIHAVGRTEAVQCQPITLTGPASGLIQQHSRLGQTVVEVKDILFFGQMR